MKTTSRISVERFAATMRNKVDLLICSASFEERCLTIPRAIHDSGDSTPSTLIVSIDDYHDYLAANLAALDSLSSNRSIVRLRANDPIETMDRLSGKIDCLWENMSSRRTLVDVTTFTRETLLILLQCLWRKGSENDQITLAYTRALEYDVGRDLTKKWLSQGIREVRSIVGFPGDLWPSMPTHLVVMAGFESERAVALVTKCEPSIVSIGVADSADQDTSAHQQINDARKKEVIRQINNLAIPVVEFTFSGYDCLKSATAVSDQIVQIASNKGRHGRINTILAPMNTKVSTIGAGLVGMRMPDVQLCYAQADLYNYPRYSSPSDTVYCFELPPASSSA